METSIELASRQPQRWRAHKALWLGLFVVLAIVGGQWVWRQVQFTRLRMPLVQAVQSGDTARVRDLLDQGVDPDTRINYKSEPFSWASVLPMLRGGHRSPLPKENTVLMEASFRNDRDVVRLLLEHGADVNAQRRDGATALIVAAHYRHDMDALSLLLQYGADATLHDENGMMAVMYAVYYNHQDQVEALVRKVATRASGAGKGAGRALK